MKYLKTTASEFLSNIFFQAILLFSPTYALIYLFRDAYWNSVPILAYGGCVGAFQAMFALVFLRKMPRMVFGVMAGVYFCFFSLEYFLLSYVVGTEGLPFSFNLVTNNLSEVWATLRGVGVDYTPYIILFSISGLFYWFGVMCIRRYPRHAVGAWFRVVVLGVALSFGVLAAKSQIYRAIQNHLATQRSVVYRLYQEAYIKRLEDHQDVQHVGIGEHNLVFLHLESVSADLVSPNITPGLFEAAQNGVFFKHIQGGSMQTIRAEEVILCGTLPAIDGYLSKMPDLVTKTRCLPKILKAQGYRTMYFQDFPDLGYYNEGEFMSQIGFDEVHSGDLMKPEDKLTYWGYANDIFYQRVFEYLHTLGDQKVFAYIAVDSANHYPFFTLETKTRYGELEKKWPYPDAHSLVERMKNGLFLQDYFFQKDFLPRYLQSYQKDSTLFVFGDHSWPAGRHEHNTFNTGGAFQENFVTSLVVVPPTDDARFMRSKVVSTLYSQMDYLALALEMLGSEPKNLSDQSFYKELVEMTTVPFAQCFVSVQPYGNKYVSAIVYPWKYLFNISENTYSVFDLAHDPDEMAAIDKDRVVDEKGLYFFKRCLHFE